MPKKILIVITKGDVGGAQVFVHNLARGLKQKGLDITVGMGEGSFLKSQLSREGISTVVIKHLKRTSNPFGGILYMFTLKRLLEQGNYDAVQFNSSNSLPGALSAKFANKKIRTIFTVHGLSVLDKNYQTFFLLRIAYRIFFKFFLSYVDVPVFVDQHDFEEAHRLGIVKRGTVIYNGLDERLMRFMPREAARAFIEKKIGHPLGTSFIVGSIGRLSYQKNYEFLIRSFHDMLAITANAIAVIIGDGPRREACKELIKKLGLQNRFFLLGEIENASSYVKAFDLFMLSSRYEGLPITLTECLFAKVPVLASDVGGNRELVSGQALYRLDDKDDFIKRFARAAETLPDYLCGEDKKQLFSLKTMTEAYVQLLS